MNTKSMQSPSRFSSLALVLGASLVLGACASKVSAPVQDQSVSQPPMSSASAAPAGPGYYTVRSGDTLNAIARQHGQSVTNLAAWNNLGNINQISVGQVLRVAPPDGSAHPSDGVEVRPIAMPGAETRPVTPSASSAPTPGGVVTTPKGGKQPYSEQALAEGGAAVSKPAELPAATPPAATPTTPAAEPKSSAPANTPWIWPGNGKVISQFSEGSSKGIDIAGNLGDPVVAAGSGKVVYAGSGLRGYGKLVIIKHDNDYLSAYAHNRELLVKEGDTVNSGQKIAEVGNTDADRPKLHFEIRKQGKPVDPMKYLPNR